MNKKTRYEKELELLFTRLVRMGRAAETAIERSVSAFIERDDARSREVVEDDIVVDRLEHEIEDECLRILLMEHPVAGDFRDVSAALKVITDLERIGDQAAEISAIALAQTPDRFPILWQKIPQTAKIVIGMVKDAVRAYINRDLQAARILEKRDDAVDGAFAEIKRDLADAIRRNGEAAEAALDAILIAKYLERIGDHAVNIGEWAEYAITGKHKIG